MKITLTKEHALFLAIILFVWLWMDFIGLWLSVFCTYFYFGMEGEPYHLARLGGVALVSVSGSFVYWLLLRNRDRSGHIKTMLGTLVLMYCLLVFFRGSDFLVWVVLLGNIVCGMAAVALYRRIHVFMSHEVLFYGGLLGVVAYLGTRLSNHGMLALLNIDGASIYVMLALLGLVMLAESPDVARLSREQKTTNAAQLYATATGILTGLCVMFLFNLSLWSSKTPQDSAALYYGTFFLGTLAGIVISRRLVISGNGSAALSIAASVGMGAGVYVVLYVDYDLSLGLLAHSVACFGTAAFWYLHARRYRVSTTGQEQTIPVFGLFAGAIGIAIPTVFFLLYANPAGFLIVLLVVSLVTIMTEYRGRLDEPVVQSSPVWLVVVLLIAAVPIPMSLLSFEVATAGERPDQPDRSQLLVMSTNVRYGWTDDYRFEPGDHLQWVQDNPADIIGYQEMNKGSLYGSFTDLLAYYRSAIPGKMVYGDASFGFGNGMSTWMPIKDSRVVSFASSDMIQRSFVWTLLEFNGQEIEVFVTHLSHLPHPNKIRQEQVAELIDSISQSRRPWILMGDFNALPSEPEIAALTKISSPVFAQQPGLFAEMSHPARDPELRLDYIFFSEHFELLSQQVVDNGMTSDHRPIRSRIRLTDELARSQ